jgi:plasmid stabilization system protein ParE
MAKRVIWSANAQTDRKNILTYWTQRNQSPAYSKKQNQLFKDGVRLSANFPNICKPTGIKNIRVKIVRDYLIIYEEASLQIVILSIWDGRQNPAKLEKILV